MKSYLLFMLSLSWTIFVHGQSLDSFDPLLGKTWYAEGSWGDGSAFKQRIVFSKQLEGNIITTESYGFIDQAQTKFGHRNHGIRKIDPVSGKMTFWEFDVFGGVTQGEVRFEGKDIIYTYKYGESMVTDYWKYVDENTYDFIVGDYQEGEWKQQYLATRFQAILKMYDITNQLSGQWEASAWDGVIKEHWYTNDKGQLVQDQQYIEDGVVQFQATGNLHQVEGQTVLMSLVHGSGPKIFQASKMTSDKITFENADYTNPSFVQYHFVDKNRFTRTIRGVEDGQASETIFEFVRKK